MTIDRLIGLAFAAAGALVVVGIAIAHAALSGRRWTW